MGKDDWFKSDFGDHIKEAEKEAARGRGVSRFWMPPDSTKEIIILDDEPFCIWEHALKINEKWKGNEHTCRKGIGDSVCPLCQSGANRYYVGFLTILDHTGFEDKEGKQHTNLRRLFPMKSDTLNRFAKFKERKKSLVGWKVEVTRSGKKSPAVGDMFDFIEKVDPFEDKEFWFISKANGGKKKPPEVYDYREILEPMSVKEMLSIGSGGYGGDKSGGDDDAVY